MEEHNKDGTILKSGSEFARLNAQRYYCPVLTMTTQRYFRLSREEISGYLQWKNGVRPLIAIDEQPPLKEVCTFDCNTLLDITSALVEEIPVGDDQEEKSGATHVGAGFGNGFMPMLLPMRAAVRYLATNKYYRFTDGELFQQKRTGKNTPNRRISPPDAIFRVWLF